MILLRKGTAVQYHVICVKIAVLRGELRAIWLLGTWSLQGSLLSPVLWKRAESWNSKGLSLRRQC